MAAAAPAEYKFEVERADAPVEEDDHVFTRDSSSVVVDDSSLEFVRGATIDFQQEMIPVGVCCCRQPELRARVGCGSSFALQLREQPGYRLIAVSIAIARALGRLFSVYNDVEGFTVLRLAVICGIIQVPDLQRTI